MSAQNAIRIQGIYLMIRTVDEFLEWICTQNKLYLSGHLVVISMLRKEIQDGFYRIFQIGNLPETEKVPIPKKRTYSFGRIEPDQ